MAKVITGVFPEKESEQSAKNDKPIPSYILHISIMFSDPLIWRRVQIPGTITLATLHDVIQLSMGWTDSHMHQFLVGKISYEPTSGGSGIRESTKCNSLPLPITQLFVIPATKARLPFIQQL